MLLSAIRFLKALLTGVLSPVKHLSRSWIYVLAKSKKKSVDIFASSRPWQLRESLKVLQSITVRKCLAVSWKKRTLWVQAMACLILIRCRILRWTWFRRPRTATLQLKSLWMKVWWDRVALAAQAIWQIDAAKIEHRRHATHPYLLTSRPTSRRPRINLRPSLRLQWAFCKQTRTRRCTIKTRVCKRCSKTEKCKNAIMTRWWRADNKTWSTRASCKSIIKRWRRTSTSPAR